MSDLIGRTLGHYRIVEKIGEGGMGVVYRAHDGRLDRDVAIKVLAEVMAGDPGRLERFKREAKAISQLSHPNICTLHDVGKEGSVDFLVMEYMEGDALSDRLEKGRIPIDEALRVAAQIADALHAAHRQGVVHRDLKPGNIMLTRDGAKLLDFGLAKLQAPSAVVAESMLATEDKPLTAEGTLVGTIQYMAPEQLEGGEADPRTDIFTFGSVVYEMLTGRKAFEGASHASLISAIMSSEPPTMAEHQPLTPPVLERAVRRCLAKDPDNRWQSAADLADELRWIAVEGPPADSQSQVSMGAKKASRFLWVALTVLFASVAAVMSFLGVRGTHSEGTPIHFLVYPPEGTTFVTDAWRRPAISPDGRSLAFTARNLESGEIMIWLRPLDGPESEPLPGTEGASWLFWSPDSRSLAFSTIQALKRIDIGQRSAQTLASRPSFFSGAWSPDGVVIVESESGIQALPARGGSIRPVTTLDDSEPGTFHSQPSFLPDGRNFLFFKTSPRQQPMGTYIGSLDADEPVRLFDHDSAPVYAPPGHLLFVRDGALFAQQFDTRRLQITGGPSPVVDGVRPTYWSGGFSVSRNGVLAFTPARKAGSHLIWFDRAGLRLDEVTAPEGAQNPELSPDGSRLACEIRDPKTWMRDIWVVDLRRGIPSRFTADQYDNADPVWSPDGREIAFQSSADVYVKEASGGGEAEGFFQSAEFEDVPNSWSADGRHMILCRFGYEGGDLWILPVNGEMEPEPFVASKSDEGAGQFSPDGRWIAYTSDESGRLEIYVRPFPLTDARWQVSDGGGVDSRWRRDGKELFYLSLDRKLMSVQVETDAATFECSRPETLFQTNVAGPFPIGQRFNYAVSPDGQRFLVNTAVREIPIHVIVNWPALLDQ